MCVQVRQPSRARKVCLGSRGLLRSARTSCRAFDFNMNDNNNSNKKDIENNNKNNDDNKDIINNIDNNNNNNNKDIDNNDKQITTASNKQ